MANTRSKSRGRQAEAARNDRRLLEAAREVVATSGGDASVALIAERAGVGIGTIYRRYRGKAELLQHLCVLAMQQAISAAEAGLADEDPWNGLRRYVTACVALRSGALAPLAGHITTTPEMRQTATSSVRLLTALVERAPLRPDVAPLDVAWLIEVFSRTRPSEAGSEDIRVHERLLTIALDGLRADVSTPLPGPPPTRRHYTRRWS